MLWSVGCVFTGYTKATASIFQFCYFKMESPVVSFLLFLSLISEQSLPMRNSLLRQSSSRPKGRRAQDLATLEAIGGKVYCRVLLNASKSGARVDYYPLMGATTMDRNGEQKLEPLNILTRRLQANISLHRGKESGSKGGIDLLGRKMLRENQL